VNVPNIQNLNIKNKLAVSGILLVSILFFGVYSFIYTGIFKDNFRLGKTPSSEGIQVNTAEDVNALGQSETQKINSTDPTEMKMKSSTLASQKVLGTKSSFGVAVSDYTNKNGELDMLSKSLNGKISTVSIFKQFGNQYNNSLTQENLNYISSSGMSLLIAWEPWNPDEGTSQSKDYLKEITAGNQDAYIKSFARSVKNFKNPTVIRFGHEMNGNWYPWGNRPQDYVDAYKHVVDLFRSEGVQNVDWMWCINAESVPTEPISNVAKYYPGNSYVDILGIDGVNLGTSKGDTKWKTFTEIFSPSYNFLASTYPKPITIAETASSELGGSKSAWVEEMFSSLSKSFPKITQIVWFSINKETDWRIDSSPLSLAAFKKYL